MDSMLNSLVKEEDVRQAKTRIRVDKATQQASCIDLIRYVTGKPSADAAKDIRNLPPELREKIPQLRINSKGRLTPVADAPTCVEIIWELPGKAAKAFRRQSAHLVCRLLGGDLSLAKEIERRYKLTSDEEKTFFLQNTDKGVELTAEEKHDILLRKAKLDLEKEELELERQKKELAKEDLVIAQGYEELEKLKINNAMEIADQYLDHRDKLFVQDIVRTSMKRKFAQTETVAPANKEISIPIVAQEMGVNTRNMGGLIGKKLVRLWRDRYGKSNEEQPPKRQTTYLGRPILENTYYEADRDLMEQAIREVVV